MRSLRNGCRQVVGKFWKSCVRLTFLSPRFGSTHKSLLIKSVPYPQFMSGFATAFSTTFSLQPTLLSSYFYPVSTWPTKTTTSSRKFIKPLAAGRSYAL